jgi:hypothetical protein
MANLEVMPARMNSGKSDRIGSRQRVLAEDLHKAGFSEWQKSGATRVEKELADPAAAV